MTPSELPKLIIGLGNPGERYESTRHNVGFMVIDALLAGIKTQVQAEHRFNSQLYSARFAGRRLVLVKPQTFMNLSGEAVAKARDACEATAPEILVVYDCLDLPLGRLRMRGRGGSGGHRGVQSIIEALGTDAFPRLRLGIGRSAKDGVVDYVLSPWAPEDQPRVEHMVTLAAEAVRCAVRQGVQAAMNQYNAAPENDANSGQADKEGDVKRENL